SLLGNRPMRTRNGFCAVTRASNPRSTNRLARRWASASVAYAATCADQAGPFPDVRLGVAPLAVARAFFAIESAFVIESARARESARATESARAASAARCTPAHGRA